MNPYLTLYHKLCIAKRRRGDGFQLKHICDGRCEMLEEGLIYVCVISGNVHHCGDNCQNRQAGDSHDVCVISGRVFDRELDTMSLIWTGNYSRAAKEKPQQMGDTTTASRESLADGDYTEQVKEAPFISTVTSDGAEGSISKESTTSRMDAMEAKRARDILDFRSRALRYMRLMMCSTERTDSDLKRYDQYISKVASDILKYRQKCDRERRLANPFEIRGLIRSVDQYTLQNRLHARTKDDQLQIDKLIETVVDKAVWYWMEFVSLYKPFITRKHYRFEHHILAFAYAMAEGVPRLVPVEKDLLSYLPHRDIAHQFQPDAKHPIRLDHFSKASSVLNQLMTLYRSLIISRHLTSNE